MSLRKRMASRREAGEMRSVTVSYRNVSVPLVTTRVGYGETYNAALLDADRQLQDGLWVRTVVSNPNTIDTDLRGDREGRMTRRRIVSGEGVTIKVEHRVSTVVDDLTNGE